MKIIVFLYTSNNLFLCFNVPDVPLDKFSAPICTGITQSAKFTLNVANVKKNFSTEASKSENTAFKDIHLLTGKDACTRAYRIMYKTETYLPGTHSLRGTNHGPRKETVQNQAWRVRAHILTFLMWDISSHCTLHVGRRIIIR